MTPGRAAVNAGAGLTYALLLAAPLAVVAYSLSPTAALEIPPSGVSLRWYTGLLDQPRLLSGLGTSVLLGLLATAGSLALGVAAALALTRAAVPGREAALAFLLSPLSLPGLVLGVGLLTTVSLVARATGLQFAGTLAPLVAAHLVITIPWVVRSVAATLESADPALEEQARSLGAGPVAALFLVTLPGARSGILAGAVFAFVVSFGNFALSLFLVSGRTTTLPVAIFETVDRYQDPTAAAISTVAILLTAGAAVLADRLSGVLAGPGGPTPERRRAERPVRPDAKRLAAAILLAGLSGCAGGGENELVIAAPPGRIADLEEHFVPAFAERTGARIVPVGLRSGDQVARVRIERGNPSLDLLWIDAGEAALLAREGLLRPPEEIQAPHLDAVGGAGETGALPPTFSSAVGFLYNTEALPEPPRSWADLFDPALAGRLALFHFGSTLGPLTVATLAHLETGDATDADAGFARLAELRPNVLDFGGSGPANNQLVAQGEAWLTLGLPAQARHLREAGAPVAWLAPAEGALALPQGLQVVAGTRRPALADAFVAHLFSPEAQEIAARALELVPARPEVPLPAGLPAAGSLLRLDLPAIGRLRPEWAARFRREILGE